MLGPDRPDVSDSRSVPTPTQTASSAEQLLAVRQFVARVGGFANARRALEMLAIVSTHAGGR